MPLGSGMTASSFAPAPSMARVGPVTMPPSARNGIDGIIGIETPGTAFAPRISVLMPPMAELISQIAPFSAAWRPFVMPSQMPDRNDPMRPTAAPTISGKTANIARTNATARPRPEVILLQAFEKNDTMPDHTRRSEEHTSELQSP